jgi:mRNA interferase RelE/StbE
MSYDIVLAPEAVEDFNDLTANVRAAVRDAVEVHLRHQPTKASLRACLESLRRRVFVGP